METEKTFLAREIGEFIWGAFCAPDGSGVSMRDILDGAALAGLHLTEAQKESVLNHMDDDAEVYTSEEEEVWNLLAAATDCGDYEKMFSWLEFVVGDILAPVMIREWMDEFTEEF